MKNRRLKKRIKQLKNELKLLLESERDSTNEDLLLTCRKNLISTYELADRFDSANTVRMEIADGFMESGQTQKAITEYHQVLKKSRNTANHIQKTEALSTIGTYFQVQGSYEAALRFFTAALHAARKSRNSKLIFKALTDLGNVYAVLDDEDQSLSCYELAVAQVEQIGGKSTDSQTNERSGTNLLVPFPRESEQPKVVSGVCNANSKADRFTAQSRTQESIPRPLGRNRTAKAVLDPGLALGYDTFHFPVSYVCTLIGSQYQKRDRTPCAYEWFKKAVMYAQSSIDAQCADALQDFATAQYKLACIEFDLGNGPQAEIRLSGLLQFCSQHELLVSEALATIQLVRVRLKSGSTAGSLPLLQEQVDKIRKNPGMYPPECFMVFKLIGDHCKYFLKDTASAERFYALYMRQFPKIQRSIGK